MSKWSEALDASINQLKNANAKKLKKKIKTKTFKNHKYTNLIDETNSLHEINEEWEQVKMSPLMLSPPTLKRDGRKIGVSERSETERKLVYRTLKNYMIHENMKEFHIY